MIIKVTQLIAEAMQIPRSVFKEIEAFVIGAYYSRSEDIKDFDIDFTGTRWDFLNYLNPVLNVMIAPNAKKCEYLPSDTIMQGEGTIRIGLKTGLTEILSHGIEHEIAHFIQELIMVHKINKGKFPKISYVNPHFSKNMGGLTSKKMLPKGISVPGYRKRERTKDGKIIWNKRERVEHSARPVEYQPNLLSTIRDLQYQYVQYTNNSKKPMSKKQFLLAILKGAFPETISSQTLKKIKGRSNLRGNVEGKRYYKYVLNNIYKLFIDGDYGDDFAYKIDVLQNDIKKRFG